MNTQFAPPRVLLGINPFLYRRRRTRAVMVGRVGVGGENPIRIQSMTTTPTMDTDATVAQTLRLERAGCEIVRITAPTEKEAENLGRIREALRRAGSRVPLVADIHFRPAAAMIAADHVDKIRINPGNFVDAKSFRVREYTDAGYRAEIARIEDHFIPLLETLKRLNRSLRIGTNHGSLSDRIMNRFGDTPLGMAESALEFARICRANGFDDVIISMKASNPRVMVAAYRLLAARMEEEGLDYPFHLGVTEAGAGEDGRIKSAAGIGSLLEDGLGDTIRVSLTEEPEKEIPVARIIARRYPRWTAQVPQVTEEASSAPAIDLVAPPRRRKSPVVQTGPISLGGDQPVRVHAAAALAANRVEPILQRIRAHHGSDTPIELLHLRAGWPGWEAAFSSLQAGVQSSGFPVALWLEAAPLFPDDLKPDALVWRSSGGDGGDVGGWKTAAGRLGVPVIVLGDQADEVARRVAVLAAAGVAVVAGVEKAGAGDVQAVRALMQALAALEQNVPVLLLPGGKTDIDRAIVEGALLCDGIGDAVSAGSLSEAHIAFAYNLLQACGTRITRAEFISCPSCGRTLFDLQSTTERIKARTGHLKGVKIAIMGCIVNGPGEMADADFGYVGGGPGKINLYVGRTCIEKGVSAEAADDRLVALIRQHGRWTDPPGVTT